MFSFVSRILVKYALSDCFESLHALDLYQWIKCIGMELIPTDYGSL